MHGAVSCKYSLSTHFYWEMQKMVVHNSTKPSLHPYGKKNKEY